MADSDIALQDIDRRMGPNASQESIASDENGMLTPDGQTSTQDHPTSQPNPPSTIQSTHYSDEHHSTELHHQLLASDGSADASDNDYETSGKSSKSKMAPYLAVFAWWIPELFASFLSVSTLGCIIGVLSHYNGSLLTEVNLPKHLTLNGVVAALATVNRACLNTPVCSALLQQMWLYLAKESEAKVSPTSRLRDLELYTDASSGAWGSLMFLCKARLPRLAACFGCIITILSLAFSTFTQQLINIELIRIDNATSPGNLPRSETYSQLAIGNQRISIYPPLDAISSIYSGMLGTGVLPIQASCPTANCTWPVTPSIGVCGGCAQSDFVPMGCNASCLSDSIDCNYTKGKYCEYRLQSGNTARLYDFVGETMMPGFHGIGFYVNSSGNGTKFHRYRDERAYLANFELFGLPFGFALEDNQNIMSVPTRKPDSLDLKATECALWMCVQARNTSISSNVQHDEIVDTFDHVNATEWFRNTQETLYFQMPAVSADLDRDNLTNFTVAYQATGTLGDYLYRNLQGNVTISSGTYQSSSDLIYGVWNGSTNASAWIDNVATSLTNMMRVANSTSRDQYNGHSYELAVTVRWSWLSLPVALVVASLVYLFVVMFQTAGSSVQSWKGSPLTLLLFQLDPTITEAAYGHVENQGGLLSSIGGTKVRMENHAGDIRKLHAC